MNSDIVTCNGCFDGLHLGHIFLLGFAAGQLRKNDKLFVMINSDSYIKNHKREKPYYNENDRAAMLLKTGVVDEVILFNEENACNQIRDLNPYLHCISFAYKNGCPEIELCNSLGINIAYAPIICKDDWSTTKLMGESVYGNF